MSNLVRLQHVQIAGDYHVDNDAVGKDKNAYRIEINLNYPKLKPTRGSQDKCIMEMIIEGFVMTEKELACFNRVRKYQQAKFLSDIATAKGDKLDKPPITD